MLVDKEEIGSDGVTGMKSDFLRHFVADLAEMQNTSERAVFRHMDCMSADVNAAYDPMFANVFEAANSSYMNEGVVITKYTGSRGKSGASDASAEYMGKVRKILNDAGVLWQIGELGKVDVGGGGTVAKDVARLNVDVVDVGVPVMSMHAPLEIVSKLDVYMTAKAFEAYFRS
jgi:aspartyl aminopeptidase